MTSMIPDPAVGPDPTVGPPPPIDPELLAGFEMISERLANMNTFGIEDIPALRAGQANLMRVSEADLHRDGAFAVSERVVPGPAGEPDISVLVCLPARATTPVAAIYHIHGGGMIMGNRYVGVPIFLAVAEELELAVVSVEYRLPPEHPHPAPVEDCYAGLLWTVEHADELGIDRDRVVVAGGSAGGGLAAATALLARDRGGPRLAGQLLAYPMLDDRNQQLLGPADGGPWSVGPAREPDRVACVARRGTGWPGRVAVCRADSGERSFRVAARLHRGRVGGDVPG
jgi:acetyl esterase/lipase